MTASVNDKPLAIDGEQAAGAFPSSTVGAGTFVFRRPGHSIRIHEFKIRKLDKEPGGDQK